MLRKEKQERTKGGMKEERKRVRGRELKNETIEKNQDKRMKRRGLEMSNETILKSDLRQLISKHTTQVIMDFPNNAIPRCYT